MTRTSAPPARPPVTRPVGDRAVAGVCGGLATHLGVSRTPVRIGFVVGALAGGLGLVAYAFLWAFTPEETPDADRSARAPGVLVLAGAGVLLLGAALGLQLIAGLDLRLDVLLPLGVIGTGVLVAWAQLDETARGRWIPGSAARQRGVLVRVLIGSTITVAGLLVLTVQGRGLAQLWEGAVASLVVLAGVGVVVAPYGLRLWRDFRAEQEDRVRATERADIAAHLHDSVLQTLVLIQRQADDPATVTRLSRAQERELRTWLWSGHAGGAQTLAGAVRALGHEVEDVHGVPVDVVTSGDGPLDDRGAALVAALREALVNAVRHGAPPVSAYVEVGTAQVEGYVRDHGAGFEPADVPADRMGLRESVVGRMQRVGGSARVVRREDGTEVLLRLPREPGRLPERDQQRREGKDG